MATSTAERLRGFGPVGVLAIAVIFASSLAGFIVVGLLVLVWAQLSETPLEELGFKPPRSRTVTLVGGALFGIVFKIVAKAVVMPLLGAPAINGTYHYVTGNAAALPGLIAAVLLSAALGEEVFFRGYLFERLGKLFGRGKLALAGTVLLTAPLFALAHYHDQGLPGVEQAALTGLVFGGLYAWRRQIWIVMVVHAAFDLAAVAMIYWGWEEAVAHWVFR